jgi:hypothetical protein
MGIIATDQNITLFLAAGDSPIFSDEWYTYRYYRVVATGAQSAVVNMTLNGQTFDLPGSTVMDCAVTSLIVNSGAGVILHGIKSSKKMFGDDAHPINVEHPPYN